MPLWHCPHCGTPQAESARCWVCRKSSTSCSTCRHFRHAVAAELGYCGLDRRRLPLRGDEMRGCWEGAAVAPIGIGARTADTIAPFRPSIAWTEVDAVRPRPDGASPRTDAAVTAVTPAIPGPGVISGPGAISGPAAISERITELPVGAQVDPVASGDSRHDASPPSLWGDLDP